VSVLLLSRSTLLRLRELLQVGPARPLIINAELAEPAEKTGFVVRVLRFCVECRTCGG
jgi:hypothetical protein